MKEPMAMSEFDPSLQGVYIRHPQHPVTSSSLSPLLPVSRRDPLAIDTYGASNHSHSKMANPKSTPMKMLMMM
jgi:hypothetical protein